jgi:c-di-GMP-binding flagellar brake protein YcgR
MPVRLSAFCSILILPLPLFAQSRIHLLAWQNAGWGLHDWQWALIIPVLACLAAMAGYLIIAHVHRRYREKTAMQETARKSFTDAISRYDLKPDEVAIIKDLLRHDPMVQPQAIFQSLPMFEKCVHAEIKRLTSSGAPKTDLGDRELLVASIRRKVGFHFVPLEYPLASTRNIASGQIGTLFSTASNAPLIHKAIVTRNTESYFAITYDPEQEDPGNIAPGMRVRFAFARQSDGIYGITTTISGTGRNATIALSHTVDLRRNQMRQYVRVETDLPLKVRLVTTANAAKSEVPPGSTLAAKMADVSGGGMCFTASQSLKPGDIISLTFSLGSDAFAGIAGRIIRIGLVQKDKKEPLYRHHVQYLDMMNNRRERIVRFVFDKKRLLSQWR